MNDELYHHGIIGQKWGVRRYQNEDGTYTSAGKKRRAIDRISKSKTSNYDKWGKSKDANVLYLTGLSGSGKSTVAEYLSKKDNAEIINLDSYLSPMSEDSKIELQNKNFNKYLDKNVPDWKNAIKNDKLDWPIVDGIALAIQNYGAERFGKNKVVAEGVQLIDNTLYDHSFYNGKPVMVLGTNKLASNFRGSIRDSENKFDAARLFGYRFLYSNKMDAQMNKLVKDINASNYSDTLSISGSSKTQFKDSGYYRRKLPRQIRKELKSSMRNKDKIIVGDAPGIDRQVQDYLKKKHYDNVEIYGPGKQVRYTANEKWKTNPIDAPEFEEGSKEWLAKKDVAMTNAATKGLAIVLDEGSKATRKNVERLIQQNKDVKIYQLDAKGKRYDRWV